MTDLDEIYQVLKPVMNGEDKAIMVDVARQIAWAYQVNQGESYWIVRPEESELVVMCCIGENLSSSLDAWYQAVIKAGFKTVRFHTQRPGLARMLKAWGPTLTEYVYRVDLDGQ